MAGGTIGADGVVQEGWQKLRRQYQNKVKLTRLGAGQGRAGEGDPLWFSTLR